MLVLVPESQWLISIHLLVHYDVFESNIIVMSSDQIKEKFQKNKTSNNASANKWNSFKTAKITLQTLLHILEQIEVKLQIV